MASFYNNLILDIIYKNFESQNCALEYNKSTILQ